VAVRRISDQDARQVKFRNGSIMLKNSGGLPLGATLESVEAGH
jgi:hypothetical protein